MGPTALLPLQRKAFWGFFRPKNPTASAGCEFANLGTKIQHATSRPPKTLLRWLVAGLSLRNSGFDPRLEHVWYLLDKIALWRVFLPVLLFFPYQYHSNNAPYSSSSKCCPLAEGQAGESWKISKRNASNIKGTTLYYNSYLLWPYKAAIIRL